MEHSPIRYPKGKRCFPWLVRVRVNVKKMVVMLFKVIMEDFDNSFGFGFKGQVFYVVFYIWGKAFYHISYGIWMWGWGWVCDRIYTQRWRNENGINSWGFSRKIVSDQIISSFDMIDLEGPLWKPIWLSEQLGMREHLPFELKHFWKEGHVHFY